MYFPKAILFAILALTAHASARPQWNNWQVAQDGIQQHVMSLQALLGNVNIPADQKTEIMKQIQAIQSNAGVWNSQRSNWGNMIHGLQENHNRQIQQLQEMLNQWNATPEQRQAILNQMNALATNLNDSIQAIVNQMGAQ